MMTLESTGHVAPSTLDPQDRFLTLVREISELQWVRESLPAQTKHYQTLKQHQEREMHLKTLLEKQIQEYRKKQDASSGLLILKRTNSSDSSYTELIERLRRCDRKLKDSETQCHAAQTTLHDLRLTKHTLDTHCLDLQTLHDEIIPRSINDPSHIIEQHLKDEVTQLANDIPKIEKDIHFHSMAQRKLYEARELMEKAMMTLPGASLFLDRHAGGTGRHPSLFPHVADISVPSLKDAEKLASEAYGLEAHASKLCKQVPLIPSSSFNRDDNVMTVLTAYRGYRLKIETILRTRLNPQLVKLQDHLTVTKYQYEQKTIDWIDQQIIRLEDWLRTHGRLQNMDLDREMGLLRMGCQVNTRTSHDLPGYSPDGRLPPSPALDGLPDYYAQAPPAYVD